MPQPRRADYFNTTMLKTILDLVFGAAFVFGMLLLLQTLYFLMVLRPLHDL